MESINAIAKVRFSSARSQTVGLCSGQALAAELLCLEPGQQAPGDDREHLYYVITGSGKLVQAGVETPISPGQLVAVAAGDAPVLVNTADQRLVCLMINPVS